MHERDDSMREYEKYEILWKYLAENCLGTLLLTFNEIYSIANVYVDSSFLDRKLDCERYGIRITKINMADRTVLFSRYTSNKHPAVR